MTIEPQSVLRWSTVGTRLVRVWCLVRRLVYLVAIAVLVVAFVWTSAQAFASAPLDAPGRYAISPPAKRKKQSEKKTPKHRESQAFPKDPSSSKRPFAEEPTPKRININNASARELVQLPGIGPAKAQRILRFRNRRGRFRRIRDLRRVKGIGRKTLAKLRSLITLGTGESVNSK